MTCVGVGVSRTLPSGMEASVKEAAQRGLGLLRQAGNADRWLQGAMAACIETAKARHRLRPTLSWQPGEPLKLLFAGYSGTRNTGADVRVEEMLRQFRHLIGEDHFEASVLTIDPARSSKYFRGARQIVLPKVFPAFLATQAHAHHGVVTCEGSMFKSKFADALSTMMVGALGLALAEDKLAIGYGGEAGAMSGALEGMVRRYLGEAFVTTRNEASTQLLSELGVGAETGTDTAWTFSPSTPEASRALATRLGLDPERPILTLCPINPFWWPVRADIGKALVNRAFGTFREAHYASVYFHTHGPEVEAAQRRYLRAFARSAEQLVQRNEGMQVLIVGMEALDRKACEALQSTLTVPSTLAISDEHDMGDLVGLLRLSSLLVSSRYHAIVTSMPGLVPSVGVTMDERIRNLLTERGHADWCLDVDDEALEARLTETLQRAYEGRDAARPQIRRAVVSHLERMGRMGQALVEYLREQLPQLPLRPELGRQGDPFAHLPPLGEELKALVHATREAAA